MRILFIVTRADSIGGAQVHVKDLAVKAKSEGSDVLVLTGQQGAYNLYLASEGIKSLSCETLESPIRPFLDFQSLRFFLKIAKDYQPDVLSLHSSKAGVLGRIASLFLGIPCTFTAHGWSFTDGIPEPSRTIYRFIEILSAPFADKVICVSDYDRRMAVDAGINPNLLVTIRNGIGDLPSSYRSNHVSQDQRKPSQVLMIARFDRQKDHYTLLKAFSKVAGAELCLVGDGPLLEEVQYLLTKFNLNSRVKLLGYRQDIPEIISQADIFVLISNWEGLPLSILEAMRASLPVIASDVGGVSEAIVEGETGYLVPRRNSLVLAKRLQQLIDQPELRQQIGKAGRKRYESKFEFERMYRQTYKIYEEVIDSN